MKKFTTTFYVALSLLIFQPAPALAVNISFDSLPLSWNGLVNNQIDSGFVISGTSPYWIGSGANFCNPQCPENGTHYLLTQWEDTIKLKLVSSGPFSAISFQYAEQYVGLPYAPEINVVGHMLNGGITTASFFVDGINDGSGPLIDFQTALLPSSFNNLIYIEFSTPGTSHFSLDNIQVSAIPEPASYAFMIAGILGISLLRRKADLGTSFTGPNNMR